MTCLIISVTKKIVNRYKLFQTNADIYDKDKFQCPMDGAESEDIMSVNGVTNATNAYTTYTSEAKKTTTEAAVEETVDTGVIYEPSEEAKDAGKKMNKIANPELFAKMKADSEARIEQFRQLVEQLMAKQSKIFANANDMWEALKSGKLEVDPETRAQAQADIAEDGYWGVNQTSDRILDFAVALAGDDKDKLNDMMEAFKKGYKQAEKTWGGELPELCQKTYDAVLEKFDKLINGES